MNLYNYTWWILSFIFSILGQRILPGIDILVVGLLISLQEHNPIQTSAILLISILLQEGCGTLDFGVSFLWYSCIIILFFIGRWLFEVENLLFVILLSLCIGLSKYSIITFMSRLQNFPENSLFVFKECMLQSLYTPILWKIFSLTRTWVRAYEDQS